MKQILASLLPTLYKLGTSHQKLDSIRQIHQPSQTKTWIQRTLKRRQESKGRKKFSRSSNRVASTILMILVALLPYTDVFLDFFIDTQSIKLQRFANLSVALWSCTVCMQATLVAAVSKLNPWPVSYMVLIYVNLSMLLGFIFLEFNVDFDSDYIFKIIVILLSFLLYFIGIIIKRLWKIVFLEERVDNEIEELTNYDHK